MMTTTTDTPRCCVNVSGSGTWGALRGHQCKSRGPKIERDGKWYCAIHDPISVKAKDDARRVKYDAKWKRESDAHIRRRDCEAACAGMANPVADVAALKSENALLRAALERLCDSTTIEGNENLTDNELRESDSQQAAVCEPEIETYISARALLAKGSVTV